PSRLSTDIKPGGRAAGEKPPGMKEAPAKVDRPGLPTKGGDRRERSPRGHRIRGNPAITWQGFRQLRKFHCPQPCGDRISHLPQLHPSALTSVRLRGTILWSAAVP